MEQFLSVAKVVVPIFVALILGTLARRGQWLTGEEVRGFQNFVMKIGLPCVLFGSCLGAEIGIESLSSMAMTFFFLLAIVGTAFYLKKSKVPYHNLPMMFGAKESGMLGMPLYIVLFGAGEAYRLGVLDMAQVMLVCPMLAILSADTGENPSVPKLVKSVLATPLVIMCLLGIGLNLSGLGRWLDSIGLGAVMTETASFLSQPVGALMIFSVGYNFSMSGESRKTVLRMSAVHLALWTLVCGAMELILCLIPGVDDLTRWAVVLYCAMPASYLAPSMGRTEQDFTTASGLCSVLTVVTMVIFCVIAVIVA